MANNRSSQVGLFVPTTNVWDVSEIYSTEVTSPAFKELLVRMYQNLNLMAQALNLKESGYYDRNEFLNSQLWFPNPTSGSQSNPYKAPTYRQDYRKVFLTSLIAGPNPVIPHGITITDKTTFTFIGGTANKTSAPRDFRPIPYVDVTGGGAAGIEIKVDSTNININNGTGVAFDVVYIVLEYLQS